MDKIDDINKFYLDNWDLYWKSYKNLNPDLATAGINDKRKLKNHFMKYGIKEKRKVTYEEKKKDFCDMRIEPCDMRINPCDSKTDSYVITTIKNNFLLKEEIFEFY